MESAKKYSNALKRLSPFYIFLIAVSPIFISLLIHSSALIGASFITWTFGADKDIEQAISATVVVDGRRDAGLKFQGTDLLDSFPWLSGRWPEEIRAHLDRFLPAVLGFPLEWRL